MTNTNTTTTDADIKAINAATLKALIERSDAVRSVQASGSREIADVKWSALASLVDAYSNLSDHLTGSVIKACAYKVETGDAIGKALRDKASGIYVPTDKRDSLPSASVMSRALSIGKAHTPDRFTAYREASDDDGNTNVPSIERYTMWLNLATTGKVGNKANVDLEATKVTGKGANRKVGPLVMKASSARTSSGPATATTVVGFFVDLLSMSNDDLAKLIADGPDVSGINPAKLRDVARSCMASVVLAEQSERIVIK